MKISESPAFKNVDPEFVTHLENTLATANNKNSVEVLGLLMAISNEANQKNIPLTPEMQSTLLQYFKNQLPKNQRGQFEAILKMFTAKKGL